LGKLENVAVTVQPAPFAVKPVKLYGILVNGALNVWEPPQLFVIVTVPVLGTDIPGPPVTVKFPLTE
jgi:hypothetical protein